MMNLAEYRHSNARLADFLPWAALVDEGIILNKDGSFQRTAKFRGPDLDSAVPAELVAVAGASEQRLASSWVRLGACSSRRSAMPQVPIRRTRFRMWHPPWSTPSAEHSSRKQAPTMSSSYFLTFLYLPPAEGAAMAERLLYEGRDRTVGADAREVLRGFVDRTNRVLQLLEGFMPECAWLDDQETLTYLHSTISTRRHRVRVPEIPMYLDALLGRPAADRRSRADAGRSQSASADGRRLSDARRRQEFWMTSIAWHSRIAGRRARSCSTRPMPPSL